MTARHPFAVAAAVLVSSAVAVTPAAATPAPPGPAAAGGAAIVSQTPIDDRTWTLTLDTPAFTAPVPVEVILPVGYDASSTHRWPVTYYLAGTNHDQAAFRSLYDGESLTAGYSSNIVAPRGDSGYWSDWYGTGAGGPPRYETYVVQQLVPLIDATFRTLADRAHRTVMGESMGGYGAMMLAARHPDLFAAAASLSGAVDTNWAPGAAALSTSPVLQGAPPDSIYGPRLIEEVIWRGHNPVDLADNLRGLRLQVRTGNEVPAPQLGESATDVSGCALESGDIQPESTSLHNTLTDEGIAHVWQQYP